MKCDIEIVMAASMSGKYGRRIKDFKKFGLQEIGNHSVKLSILVGTEEMTDLDKGWPDGIEINIVTDELDHSAAKMNSFYANYSLEDLEQTKWLMRVDDDSVSKIGPLLDLLENLDYLNDPIYLTTQPVEGDTSVEKKLLSESESKYKGHIIWHEVECCILSQACFKRILKNDFCVDLLKKRALIESGYTDICLAACARECGIFPSWFGYINHYSNLREFLLSNVYHIHFVANDVNKQQFEIICNDRSECKIKDRHLMFCEKNKENKLLKKNLVMLKQNGIAETNLGNITYWTFNKENLEISIYNSEPEVEFVFELKTEEHQPHTLAKFSKKTENKFYLENGSSFFI